MTQTGSPQRTGLDRASLERALEVAERGPYKGEYDCQRLLLWARKGAPLAG